MSTKSLTAMQLAELVVMVLKQLEDLDPPTQREVLEAAIATVARLEKK